VKTTVTKNETVTLHDNSSKAKWRITTSSGTDISAPGVCFVIPPPNQEAIDTANELKRRYDQLNKEFANAIDSVLKQIQKLKDDEEERKRREREEAERRAREEAERRAREEADRRAREEAERRAREEAERKERERRVSLFAYVIVYCINFYIDRSIRVSGKTWDNC
jgi:predicted ATP-dependent protease